MKRTSTVDWLYRAVSLMILAGFLMLCQPFSHAVFSVGFPLLLAGVVGFMVLDHLPARVTQGRRKSNG